MDVADIRKKYPMYQDVSDEQLVKGFHRKFYSDMPFEDFAVKVGYSYEGVTPGSMQTLNPPRVDPFAGKPLSEVTKADVLPAMGAAAGDIVGSIAGGKLLSKAPMLGRMLGSGVGGFGGSVGGQKAAGQDIDYREAGMQGAIGAGTEGMVGVGGKMLKGGLNLASDILMPQNMVKRIEKQALNATTQKATKFLDDIAPDIVKKQTPGIKDVNLMADVALDENRMVYNAYSEALEAATKKEGAFLADNTAQFLGDLKEETRRILTTKMKNPPGERTVELATLKKLGFTEKSSKDLKELFDTDMLSPKQVEALLANALQSGGGRRGFLDLSITQQGLRKELKERLLKDLESTSPEAKALKDKADDALKKVKRFQVVSRLYKQATQEDPRTLEQIVNPGKLAKLIYANKSKIMKEAPELWPKLEKQAAYYTDMAKKLGNPTFLKPRTEKALGGIASHLAKTPAKVAGHTIGAGGGWSDPKWQSGK